jgi:short-subunit dehydrogenase
MNLKQKYGTTALIAGASEGIGAAFAEQLARNRLDLVLIARRKQPLGDFAGALEEKYGIKTCCIPCDLSEEGELENIKGALSGREIDILVYNAALSHIGPFIQNDPEEHLIMARVNMIAPLNMVHYFGGQMLKRKRGAVVLMTSLAGFQGSGYLSVYAATKAFNRILAESLWYEWKESNVDVIACCAGATSTPGYIASNPGRQGFFAPRVLTPAEVAEECLGKLGKRPSYITGRGNRFASFFMQKVLPRKTAVTIMGNATKKLYGI